MQLKNIFVYPRYPDKLKKLFHLSYNLWTLWDAEAVRIFYRIDPVLFRAHNKNPVAFLHSVPPERLTELSKDEAFIYELEKIWNKFERYTKHKTPFDEMFNQRIIAYFSMEYGLHQSIPNYAGGLGILSGDHLKGASDLGIPIMGVGLFYRYGYFNQRININGIQEEAYRENNVFYMPVNELRTNDGHSIYVTVPVGEDEVKVKVWYVSVGRTKLLLLDTNIEDNPPDYRKITEYLYDDNRDIRIMQEIIIGLAGVRVLEAIMVNPDVYHLNEGHSAFSIIERLNNLINKQGLTFEQARALVKSTTVFTTHTPVAAGNENFHVDLIKKYLKPYIETLGISFEDFIKLGFHDEKTIFWMPAFAIRFSQYINGVSRIHKNTSKEMWKTLFPQMVVSEIPIASITNGVHYSWLSEEMRALFESYIGPDYMYSGNNGELWERINTIPDEEIWDAHMKRKRAMISFLREIMEESYTRRGFSILRIKRAQKILNINYLTIGYARRIALYKRPTLLIQDQERIKKILTSSSKPVQIIFAGKAHPADIAAKNMIKEIIDFARQYELEDRLIFIENYDRHISEHLVQGVDVWINTPVKPLEASGTSGMKAGINGVLNLSVLDGWWPECYNGNNGWAITAGELYENPQMRDIVEANQIYELLEEEISPLFYDRDERDIPKQWIKKMKESIFTVYKDFNINRMLSSYSKNFYIPSIVNRERLVKDEKAQLISIIEKASLVKSYWEKVYIKQVTTDVEEKGTLFSGDRVNIECILYLDDADPSFFDVEVFYYIEVEKRFETVKLKFSQALKDKTGRYEGQLELKSSGIQSFNLRLVPSDEDVRALHPELIKWKDS